MGDLVSVKAAIIYLQHTYEEAEKGFDETLAKEKGMNRDDRIHGALLILNELVRISSMEGEVSDLSRWQLVWCYGWPNGGVSSFSLIKWGRCD